MFSSKSCSAPLLHGLEPAGAFSASHCDTLILRACSASHSNTPDPAPRPRAQALAACAAMRPPVDISVGGDDNDEGVGVGGARTEYRSAVAA